MTSTRFSPLELTEGRDSCDVLPQSEFRYNPNFWQFAKYPSITRVFAQLMPHLTGKVEGQCGRHWQVRAAARVAGLQSGEELSPGMGDFIIFHPQTTERERIDSDMSVS